MASLMALTIVVVWARFAPCSGRSLTILIDSPPRRPLITLLMRHYGYALSDLSSRLIRRAERPLYVGIMAPVPRAGVAELGDAPDSKSGSPRGECRFEPDLRYWQISCKTGQLTT